MKKLQIIGLLAICLAGFKKANAQAEATFYTSMGNFDISLTDTLTPRTVDSFIARVSQKFYDGLIFHRVIDNFVIQGGDPQGTGMGGPGYTIPDEIVPSLKNVPASLAMANAGPNTNGSQFYFNLVNNSSLNGHYTVFGMVTSNFTVVQNIGKVPVDGNSKPLTPVTMDSIRITKFPASVSKITNDITVTIAPNPCRGEFNIELPRNNSKVEIMNMGGQIVYTAEGKKKMKVDFQNQPKGLYIVNVTNDKGKSSTKLVVQ